MGFPASEFGTQRFKDALDRHITGNYGEGQFRDMPNCDFDCPDAETCEKDEIDNNCPEHMRG